MRTLLYVVVGLVVVVVAAAAALPYVIPQETLRTTIAGQIERATGREIALGGDVRLAVLPRPAASLGGLTVAGTEGVDGPPLATLDGLDAELALLPLFSGDVQVDRFVLRGLEIELIVDEQGRTNWATAPTRSRDAGTPAEPSGEAADAGATGAPPLPAISLGDVRLVDGAVRYTDRRSGTVRSFESVEGTVAMAALDQPLTLDLAGELDGRPLEVDGRLAGLAPLLQGGATGTELALAATGLSVNFAGDVTAGAAPEVTGDLDLGVEEAAATLGWLAGETLTLPVESLDLAAAVAASPTRIALDQLELGVDDVRGTGDVVATLDGPRPRVTGRLDLGPVDLAEFGMTDPTAAGEGAAGDAAEAGAGGGGGGDADGWSREPIAYTHPPVDLDLTVSVESLRSPPLRFGAGTLAVDNDAERLLLTLETLGFYDGDVAGSVRVSPAGDGLVLAKDVRLENVRTGGLLADLAEVGFLDGRADLDFALRTRGASAHDLVAAADGDGRFAVERAVLKGLEGRPRLEALRALLALGGEPGQPLRIAAADGTIELEDGVATNRDLVATTTNLRLTGDGRIDLVNRRVPRYRLTPEATGALAGASPLQRVLVPLLIEGPFDRLRVRPDPAAVGSGAVEEVERALEAAGEKAREGDLEGAAETIINEGLGGALEQFGIRP